MKQRHGRKQRIKYQVYLSAEGYYNVFFPKRRKKYVSLAISEQRSIS